MKKQCKRHGDAWAVSREKKQRRESHSETIETDGACVVFCLLMAVEFLPPPSDSRTSLRAEAPSLVV